MRQYEITSTRQRVFVCERGYTMLFRKARAALRSIPCRSLVLGDSKQDWVEARMAG